MTLADVDGEVLGHLPAVHNRTDRQADFGGAAQRRVPAADQRFDTGKCALGGCEQIFALACPLRRQITIAAHDQAFAREQLGSTDFGEITLIEQ